MKNSVQIPFIFKRKFFFDWLGGIENVLKQVRLIERNRSWNQVR